MKARSNALQVQFGANTAGPFAEQATPRGYEDKRAADRRDPCEG